MRYLILLFSFLIIQSTHQFKKVPLSYIYIVGGNTLKVDSCNKNSYTLKGVKHLTIFILGYICIEDYGKNKIEIGTKNNLKKLYKESKTYNEKN